MKLKYIIGGVLGVGLCAAGAFVVYDRNVSALLFTSDQAAAVALSRTETNNVVSWLKKLQYSNSRYDSYGALTVSDGVSAYEDGTGTPLRRVTPYFSHLAVLGVLDSNATGSLTVAERWIRWYIKHLDATAGVPLDTWYSLDGKYGTKCPVKNDPVQCNTVDAEDSSAALFLVVVDRYVAAGGSKTFVRNNKVAIRSVENTLTKLIDADGLAWAKQTYPIKYLMDNVEVLSGLEAAARIESTVFRDTFRSRQFATRSTTLTSALHGSSVTESMFNPVTGQYAVYKDGAGTKGVSNMQTWYPDIMSQLWPVAFGQTSNMAAFNGATKALSAKMPPMALEKGDCASLKAATGDAHAPVVSYVLRRTGNAGASALTKCMYGAMQPTYTWPVTAADAGWLLRK